MTLKTRTIAEERMDAEDLPAETLAAVLADLAQVNTVTLAARPTLGFLRRAVGTARSFRLLDVGFGDGDMLRRIARWAARRGIAADLVGIDLNPNSAPAARARTPDDLNIDYRTGDYAALAGKGWDVIISSLVAHHMSHDQLIAFLLFMEAQAARGWLVNDLHRHTFAYRAFPITARLFGWHEIVRQDGTLSIARSYRPAEWPPIMEEAGVRQARVFCQFPFRLCVERLR